MKPEHFNYLAHETPYQDLAEVRRLASIAPSTPNGKVIVEVGSWVGLSAWSILQEPTVDRLFCVDHWEGSPDGDQLGDRLGQQGYSPEHVFRVFCSNHHRDLWKRCIPLTGTSELMASVWNLPASMIYLDGDHEKLARDIALWMPHVVAGGILAGHDFNVFDSVNRDVDQLARTLQVHVEGHVWSTRIFQPSQVLKWRAK
jgi:predicted O-methyltransferase YrrM